MHCYIYSSKYYTCNSTNSKYENNYNLVEFSNLLKQWFSNEVL